MFGHAWGCGALTREELMAHKVGSNASLSAGIVLLAVSCLNIGYGLCMTVNGMENAMMPLGIGVMLSGLATLFIAKSAKMLSEQATPPRDDA
jgi:predicted phage tail protein